MYYLGANFSYTNLTLERSIVVSSCTGLVQTFMKSLITYQKIEDKRRDMNNINME